VTSNKQHIVGIPRLGLSNDVVCKAFLNNGVNAELCIDLLTLVDSSKEFETKFLGKSTSWDETGLVENTAIQDCSNNTLPDC
jgi:hypothetical protein